MPNPWNDAEIKAINLHCHVYSHLGMDDLSKPTSELFECDCHQQFSGLGTSHNVATFFDAERVNVHWKQTSAQHSPSTDGFDEAFPSIDTKPLASQIPNQRTLCSIQVHHLNPSSKSIIRILCGFPTATSAGHSHSRPAAVRG